MMKVHSLKVSGLATLVALTGLFLFLAGQADASFSNFTLSTSFGTFSHPESIAIDESTGDVYVYDYLDGEEAALEKFDSAGNPVDFAALGTNRIALGEGRSQNENQVAVDNSSGPAKGDIYVADGNFSNQDLLIYGSDGKALGELSRATNIPWGRVNGVAIDPAGDVYVGIYSGTVNKYKPLANPVVSSDYRESLRGLPLIADIGVDGEGNVYANQYSGAVSKYSPLEFGASVAEGTQIAPESFTFAVASSFGGELFVDRPGEKEGEIVQYDASGNQLATFGANVAGLGFDAKDGKLYLANSASKTVEIWQGEVGLPSLQTNEATNLSGVGTATLNGALEPEESAIESCGFEYGPSSSYGTAAACEQATPITGSDTVAVSANLSGIPLNQVLHYRLVAENAQGTAHGVDKTFVILVQPTVEDQAPVVSAITRASAKLTGTINPKQAETSYHFEIGTSQSYGESTPVAYTGNGISSDTTVAQQVGELLPNTTYHYRLVADNVAGRVVGVDHTFTTGTASPPVVVTVGSTGITENAASITGTVDTNGLPTTYGFEIGTSADYGPRTGLGAVGAGESQAPVSLALTSLQPGTTYHYRLTATNVDGTSYGVDQTFTTGVFANTFAEPPAPLPFVVVPSFAFPAEQKAGVVKKKVKAKPKKVKKHGKAKGKKKNKKKK